MGNCIITRRYFDQGGEPPVSIVSWQNGTDAEIAAMIAAADAGQIDLNDYWSIGDERTVHLDAMTVGHGLSRAQPEQDIIHVLANEGYGSQSGIHYVVAQKDCLDKRGRANSQNTNNGSWSSSNIRTDLNSKYYNAIADADYKSLFKPFSVITASQYNSSSLKTTTDYVALFAEKEIIGSAFRCQPAEANALSQIEYYRTESNRTKIIPSESSYGNAYWLLRSPSKKDESWFVNISIEGGSTNGSAYSEIGIAPFMCI